MTVALSLVDQWKKCDEQELAEFISLLSYLSALKLQLSDLDSKISEEERRSNAFKKRLELIEEHKLFKLLKSNQDFADAYKWIETSKAPDEYKKAGDKIKLLESVVVAFTMHTTRLTGERICHLTHLT